MQREREKETFRRQRHHQSTDQLTDDGVDDETSLSLSLHLYLSSPPLHFLLTLTFGDGQYMYWVCSQHVAYID